ncbi:MAG: MerR family transcriptional regulator [Candidatus Aminicenantes bacterium]|nr:MerR family transcriptional regulator [Candidatus Aminicenantes bacterium]
MNKIKKSDKIVYSLSEVATLTKLNIKTINRWEKEFYFLNSGQTGSGKKIFREKDLKIIKRLNELIEQKGLTHAGAKRKIEKEFEIKGSVPVNPERLKKVLFQIKEQLVDLSDSLEK